MITILFDGNEIKLKDEQIQLARTLAKEAVINYPEPVIAHIWRDGRQIATVTPQELPDGSISTIYRELTSEPQNASCGICERTGQEEFCDYCQELAGRMEDMAV